MAADLNRYMNVMQQNPVGKTVTKKKFWILDFVVLVNSVGFKQSYETI